MDLDRNDGISFTEFKSALMGENVTQNPLFIKEAFCFFDRNGDDAISIEDLKSVLNENERGSHLIKNSDLLSQMIEEVDLNNDNKIDYKEFCRRQLI